MREKINVFYYPEMAANSETLKKAILFFDEIHFMDRPSFMFGPFGSGQYGTIGAQSPLREIETSFRDHGVPLFVHDAPGGPVYGEFYEQIKGDVNDPLFLRRFQEGLRKSQTFRDMQISPGNYGAAGTQEDVVQKLLSVDLSCALASHETAINLLEDSTVRPYELSNLVGCTKTLVSNAVTCSAKINFALQVSSSNGFIPLADASPYGDLLGAKYARAINALHSTNNRIQITDLSFGIFDELVKRERLETMTFKEIVDYRKASEAAREEFLEHLSAIQAKQSSIGIDGDYTGAIGQIITTEILPAARSFRNRLTAIDESLFGTLAKGILGYAGGLQLFGDLSWEKLLLLAGAAGAYVGNSAIDALVAKRAAKRECSISYVLSLDK